MAKKNKRVAEILKTYDKLSYYTVEEAIDLVLKNASAKFNETIELHILLGIDPRKSDQTVRGTVVLPHGTGKTPRIIAFVKADKEKEALEAGAVLAGAEELVEKVKGGWSEFDICVATPDMTFVRTGMHRYTIRAKVLAILCNLQHIRHISTPRVAQRGHLIDVYTQFSHNVGL